MYEPPQNSQRPPGIPPETPGKGLGIASMVLGICSLTVPFVGLLCAIVGLVTGVTAKKQLTESGAPTGMATAGIVMSIVGLAVSILIMVSCVGCGACLVCFA